MSMISLLPALVWAVFVNSAGMIADGYDLFVVDLVIAIVSQLHPDDITPEKKGFMACMAYAGVISGMVLFGVVADTIGQKTASLLTTALASLGCITCACCCHSVSVSLAYQLGICRFILGLGIGGEYPVSMTLGSGKKSSNHFRDAGIPISPKQILALNIFCFQIGSVCAPAFGALLMATGLHLEYVWRILILLGMLPSVFAFIARTKLVNRSQEYASETDGTDTDGRTAAPEALGFGDCSFLFGEDWRSTVLVGCCLAWAFHNFVFFGQGSFRSLIDEQMFDPSGSGRDKLQHHASFGFFLTIISLLSVASFGFIVHRVSLFWLQLLCFIGFSLIAGLCSLCMGAFSAEEGILFALLCCWTVPLTSAGIFTYIIPTQHFPAKILATNCGIAAASGKAGALVGTALFPLIEHSCGMSGLMLTCCVVGAAGVLVTAALTPKDVPTPDELKALTAKD